MSRWFFVFHCVFGVAIWYGLSDHLHFLTGFSLVGVYSLTWYSSKAEERIEALEKELKKLKENTVLAIDTQQVADRLGYVIDEMDRLKWDIKTNIKGFDHIKSEPHPEHSGLR